MQEEIKEIRHDVKHLVREMSSFREQYAKDMATLKERQKQHDKYWRWTGRGLIYMFTAALSLAWAKFKSLI